jgi:hypothetical protein
MRRLRIGCGAGFADDRIDPAADLAERGGLDYLVFECLAERMEAVLPACARQGIKVITNMGAANPLAAARATAGVARAADRDTAQRAGHEVTALWLHGPHGGGEATRRESVTTTVTMLETGS